MDYLSIVYATAMVVITIVLAVVGVYVVMILMEVRHTLHKLNTTLDTVEEKVQLVSAPLQRLGGMATGMATGFKVFETFVSWLQRQREDNNEDTHGSRRR